MVKSIETQIHEAAIEDEELRCQKIEAQNRLDPKKKDKKVPRRKVGKPWTRGAYPKLCQETEWLARVSEYDYDLLNPEFQDYCRMRGILHMAGPPESTRWGFCVNHGRGPAEYFKEIGRTPPQPTSPDSATPPPEVDTAWRIVRIARGKLQDCWELFTAAGNSGGQ